MNESPVGGSATFTADDRRFVFSVARRIVRDDDAAADVTQDALLLAFRYRDRFRGDARYRTWLYRIACTAAITYLRRRRRRRTDQMVSLGAVAEACAPGQNPEEHLACAEVALRTATELAALDDRYGDVLRMRFVDGLSEAEVADALGLSLPTVKIRTHRGRQALRAAVGA
ncbi:MAG TPA: sigma-70 family RNA polymerase sigma factor [Kofleriaceae bacterium]|nr:sigma-70 family RNA polymerase sigma factor [Kofleriaceae bacterium]